MFAYRPKCISFTVRTLFLPHNWRVYVGISSHSLAQLLGNLQLTVSITVNAFPCGKLIRTRMMAFYVNYITFQPRSCLKGMCFGSNSLLYPCQWGNCEISVLHPHHSFSVDLFWCSIIFIISRSACPLHAFSINFLFFC